MSNRPDYINTRPPYVERIACGMTWERYKGEPGVNPSRLVHGLKSMKHFKSAFGADEKPQRSMLVGSATHALIFEAGRFFDRYAVFNGIRNEKSKAYQTFQWKYPGREAIKPDEYDQAARVADAVLEHPLARAYIEATEHEVSLFCEDFGIQCKGRVDAINSTALIDLKTTTNVEKHAFGRVFGNLHYAAKLACYQRWAQKLTGNALEVFVIAVETKPPYDVAVIPIPDSPYLENSWPGMAQILESIPDCVDCGRWPGVADDRLYELAVSNWAMAEEEILDWSE